MLQVIKKNKFEWREDYKPLHGESAVYQILASLIHKYKPESIFEIGTCMGSGTIVLALYSDPDTVIYTLDITKEMNKELNPPQVNETLPANEVGTLVDKWKLRDKVVQIICDSKKLRPANLGTFDMVFIDGRHTYDYVINDTHLALSMGPKVVVWHDYQLPEVRKYIDEFAQSHDVFVVDVESIDNTLTAFWINDEFGVDNISFAVNR